MGSPFIQFVAIPLRTMLSDLRTADREAADLMDGEIAEWAVSIDSRLEPRRVEIVLLSDGSTPSATSQAWWRNAVDRLREGAGGGLMILGPRFERLDQMSVSDYRRLTALAKPHQKFSNE
ncbi:hypothetical protein STVIR_4787 [Streptomyces viridochromogenes Tue57]|uniref:Uncharacterized protein n=2 Tax=Streptomyces viridochromogenes TaxID=1938 RepID=L8P9R4_STRVR|nr:hypothetical protein STVIR_4787 [Streptomyces viridochromogenes Tue57]